MHFGVLSRPGSYSTKLRVWPRQNNDFWIMRFCCHAQMCLWWHKAHVSVFTFLMSCEYVTPTMIGATFAFCAVKTDRRLYGLSSNAMAAAGFVRHCVRNSRENQNKWVVFNKRFSLVKCDTWAIWLYPRISCMGRYFDYCTGFISSCHLSWFCWFCFARWRSQRSRGVPWGF